MRLVYIALGWTAGIFLAAALPAGGIIPFAWLVLAALAIVWLRLAWHTPGRKLLLFLVAFGLGGYHYLLVPQTSDITRYNNTGGVQIEGVVVSEPDIRDDRVQLRVQAETIFTGSQTYATDGLVLVNAPRLSDVRYGDRIRATGELITPAEFDTFSYSDFLARSGVFSVMQNAILEVVNHGEGSPFFAALFDLKMQVQQAINRALPEPAAGLLTGILLGNERGISPELSDAFSRVGASHVIAISGFNMAVISGVVMGFLEKALSRKKLAAGIGISFLIIYTLFVGANAAVVRAALMSSLLVLAPLFRRNAFVPASLALLVLFLTLLNPLALWDISFQLSFLAVLGLSMFSGPLSVRVDALLEKLFPAGTARFLSGTLSEPIVASLAAQILTTPLIVLYFQRLSVISLLVNLLIGPVQAVLLFAGAIAAILALVAPIVPQFVFWLALLPLAWTLAIVREFARLPFADVVFAVDPRLIAAFFVGVLTMGVMQVERPPWYIRLVKGLRLRVVFNTVMFCGIGLVLLIFAVWQSRPDGQFHVWFLDMGHGNAVLMQTPGGAHILVDGGRFPSRLLTALGDKLPFNDRDIEMLIITQPDEFDTSALPAVLARYSPGVVITNGQPSENENYLAIEAAIAPYPLVNAVAGYNLTLDDGVMIEVLNPTTPPQLGDSMDDAALVLRVGYGEVSFLLTSDASFDAQSAVLNGVVYPSATVLQLPQHGTVRSLSAAFLEAVNPSAVVAQIDPANRRGDPDEGVLMMLPETIPLFRTDEGGTVHFWSDGQDLWAVQEQ